VDQYYFLYKDALGRWCETSNPVFIAQHTYCRAVPKEVIEKQFGGRSIRSLIDLMNDRFTDYIPEVEKIVQEYKLY